MNGLEDKLSLDEQQAILNYCITNNVPLQNKLHLRGFTYDNLRYVEYGNLHNLSGNNEILDDIDKPDSSIPSVSFFSGAGGLDIGFAYAGFNTIASIEYNALSSATLRLNHPNTLVIGPPTHAGDISERETLAAILRREVGLTSPFDGVFHGGPPCQPFSIAANQRFRKTDSNFKRRGFDDEEKGNLLFDYLWFIEQFMPRAFVIENVAGIAELDSDNIVREHLARLSRLGYYLSPPTVINAAYYGVPQKRLRWIVMGTRNGSEPIVPKPNRFPTPCYSVFQRPLLHVENHSIREHEAESIKRYMQLTYGKRDHLGRVDRLDPLQPSKTVIAGGTKGGGRSHLHPYIPRTLSVRECARLQTFPDNYTFTGAVARQFNQVGNAVPPLLAYKLALEVRRSLCLPQVRYNDRPIAKSLSLLDLLTPDNKTDLDIAPVPEDQKSSPLKIT